MYPSQYCNPCNQEPVPCTPVPAPPECVGEPCAELYLGSCVKYTGESIPQLGIANGDNLNTVIQILSAKIIELLPPVIN